MKGFKIDGPRLSRLHIKTVSKLLYLALDLLIDLLNETLANFKGKTYQAEWVLRCVGLRHWDVVSVVSILILSLNVNVKFKAIISFDIITIKLDHLKESIVTRVNTQVILQVLFDFPAKDILL